jgi:hypothetical protein
MTTNIEKRIVLAEADPMSHMELELTTAIQEAYEMQSKKVLKEPYLTGLRLHQ